MQKQIGTVGVDSGQVAFIKEKDIHLWAAKESGEKIAIAFWGRDEDKVAETLKEQGVNIQSTDGSYYFMIEGDSIEKYKAAVESEGNIVMTHVVHDNPYDRLFIQKDEGKMEIRREHKELFYYSSTYGDAMFPVYEDKNGFSVWFKEVKAGDSLTQKQLDTITVNKPTNYVFCDPCYLDEGGLFGTIITLKPEIPYHIIQVKDKNNRTVALMVNTTSEIPEA